MNITVVAYLEANAPEPDIAIPQVAEAQQRFIDLSPLADEQFELEKQLEDLTSKKARYDELVKEGRRLVQQRDGYLQQLEERQKRIAAIEPLQPVAALLQERVEAVAHLRAQQNERLTTSAGVMGARPCRLRRSKRLFKAQPPARA